MNIFFDLDGTLLDSRERLYRLFQYLVKKSGFTFDEYWKLKRQRKVHKQILEEQFSYSLTEIDAFEKEWMCQIEEEKWLELDSPFAGVTVFLNDLQRQNTLFLVTARQNEAKVLKQIDTFGWTDFFDKVLVTKQLERKYNLLKREVNYTSNDWIVGDTGEDIDTGKKLGIKTAGVLSGFQSREILIKHKPDVLVENVKELKFY